MNQVQAWFDRILGVHHVEHSRYELARKIFTQPLFDASAFQMPACWRRRLGVVSRLRRR